MAHVKLMCGEATPPAPRCRLMRSVTRLAVVAFGACLFACTQARPRDLEPVHVNAANFVARSLGVNAGLDHTTTAYGDVRAIASAMAYLGLRNMRVTIATTEPAPLAVLASQGLRFNIGRDPLWISDAEFHSRIAKLQSA